MNQYEGIPFANLPDPKDPDFSFRLKNLLGILDRWSRDTSDAFGQIKQGYVPDGSKTPLYNADKSSAVQNKANAASISQGVKDTGNIQEWYNAADSLRAYIGPWGDLTVPYLSIYDPEGTGTATVFTSNGDMSLGSASIGYLAVTGNTDLQADVTIERAFLVGSSTIIDANGLNDSIQLYSTGTANTSTFDVTGIGNAQIYSLPAAGGVLLTPASTANLGASYKYLMNTTSGGFADSASNNKTIRFDLTTLATSTNRNIRWTDISGSAVVVGNTTSASGTLGASSLTAQTGSIAAVTLLTGTTATAGMYRVSAYMKTTTAGTAGTVKATVAWNDGAAQTLDVPLMTTAGAAATVPLNTLNAFGQGSVVVYAAASQNISYTTTVTGATGSPQYYIYVRIEKL